MPRDKTPPWRHFERNSGSCRHSQVSYLVLTVEDIDAVLIPAQDPAVSEETAQQPELSICWTISSDWTGTRKHLKLRDLAEKKCPSVCCQRHTDGECSSQLARTPLNTCVGCPFADLAEETHEVLLWHRKCFMSLVVIVTGGF